MRVFIVLAATSLFLSLGIVGARAWQLSGLFPKPAVEVVQLTAVKRADLIALKNESKFRPHNFPPLGYTGAATAEDAAKASAAVDDVIESVLSKPNGPIGSRFVTDLFGTAMDKVDLLETEDRDRTSDYLLEIWYYLGFRGATGRFAYGAAFSKPPGYGEPLPVGWIAPDKPRPIGRDHSGEPPVGETNNQR